MEEEKSQKELFEFDKPKRRFSPLAEIFRFSGVEGPAFAVTLKLDKIVFISIVIMMAMVVIYAVGVEQGKSISRKAPAMAVVQKVPQRPAVDIPAPQPAVSSKVVPAAAETIAPSGRATAKPYTIAVSALSKRDTAASEVARLKANAFDAFVIYREPFYVVCVGSFADKTSARSIQELNRVKRFNKDAYFKAL